MFKVLFISFLLICNHVHSKMTQVINTNPVAKKIPYKQNSDNRVDNYHWLRDDKRTNTDVLSYLTLENKYTDTKLLDQKPLIATIYKEIVSRLPEKEKTVPYRIDDYWYYSRFKSGNEYNIFARKLKSLEATEEIMVDMNERAKNSNYFQSNYQAISPNQQIFGFSEDKTGRRNYSLYFKNLNTGFMFDDVVKNTTGSIVWALDNKTFFYTKKHKTTLLPYQVFRHTLGSSEEDVLVYEEQNNTYSLSISASTSKNYIYIDVESTTNSEVLVLDANNPFGEFVPFLPREKDHLYSVEELNDEFYILSNWQAINFRLLKTRLSQSSDKSKWNEIIPHSSNTLLYEVMAFNEYLVINQRSKGLLHLKLYNLKDKTSNIIKSDQDIYTMWFDYNPQQNTTILRYNFASMTTPYTVYDYDMKTGEQELLKQDEVIGDFKSSHYQSKRVSFKARDGVEVPVSLVYKKSDIPLSLRPILIYGYGSYGVSIDPTFSYSRLSLLDRGFVFAIAHVRGSQANGRTWYEDGKLLKKKNTFTDFIDVTKGLVSQGYGDKKHVFAMGGSAGGLLMGVIANMNPELYKGVIAAVPFVDVISTMLDEDIPLTTGEFDEWGNPKNKIYYDYMLSYSPYDNVKKQDYPNMFVTTGLHDSQVQYWEPAKWVAKLRDLKTDNNLLIMRTNMDAGHGGASGRYQQYKEVAEEYGFLLKLVNK